MPTKNNNNRKIIRYELRNNSDIYSEVVFKYLIGYCTNSAPQSYIDKIVKAHTLPLGLSLDHEHYRHVVIESLTFLLAQVDLIENVTGISVRRYSPELIQPSMVGHFPYPNSYPTVQPIPQPSPQAMGAVNPTLTPTVRQSENEAVSKFREELPITEEKSETTSSETVLSTLEELEQKLNDLLQKIADGEDVLKIVRIINNLEPEDEEAWTEEMWNFYDRVREEVLEANYKATFDFQEN